MDDGDGRSREVLPSARFVLGHEHVADVVSDEIDDNPALWVNLVSALRAAGVATTAAALRRAPARVELDTALRAELER
jgi:hypothetical protein